MNLNAHCPLREMRKESGMHAQVARVRVCQWHATPARATATEWQGAQRPKWAAPEITSKERAALNRPRGHGASGRR